MIGFLRGTAPVFNGPAQVIKALNNQADEIGEVENGWFLPAFPIMCAFWRCR